MITIQAMVRVGPWTLVSVARHSRWTTCERCPTSIKEVWTCVVDPAATEHLAELNGQLEWHVGSTCGPTLIGVSDEVWNEHTKGSMRRMRLLVKVDDLLAAAARKKMALPDVILERRALLVTGEVTEKEIDHLGLVVGTWTRKVDDAATH